MCVEVGSVQAGDQGYHLLRWKAPPADDNKVVVERLWKDVVERPLDIAPVQREGLMGDHNSYLVHTYRTVLSGNSSVKPSAALGVTIRE